MSDFTAIQSIRNFKSLVKYLRVHLDWPVDEEDAEDLTFEYEPGELGLDEKVAVQTREIKQIRPLVDGQPWGVFWIDFEPKRLPVVAMRRILAALVKKKRAGKRARQAVWDLRDLMFISATGEGNRRGISFAHFRETDDGQPQLRTFLWDAHETQFYHLEKVNLEALRWPANPADLEGWRAEWAAAFTAAHREVITTAQALASQMAHLAAATRALVNEVFQYEKASGPLHKLYDAFKRALIHDLSTDDFADMYAQTVAYGLFSARATPGVGPLDLENAAALIPKTNPFLRELFAECLKVGREGKHQIDLDELGVGELVDLLNRANMPAIEQDFGRTTRGADPVIHFYESFLREYDAEKKVRRGVFYTPDPVVSFIVRSVDYLLRTEFGCKDGFATPLSDEGFNVQVLDPATGTGTFLKYVIEQIYNTFTQKHKHKSAAERKRLWNEYVPKHLLPRLYGFELMMAPYAVAHMKLGLELKKTEYDFASDERLRVYLTNALQSVDEIPRVDTAFLAHEAEEANTVKTNVPITVVIGNPPYSGHSANASKNADGTPNFIGRLLRDYYFVDGQPLGEKNPKWLQDDYVKFLRWAQWRIEQTGAGIVAMITNHGYLDNPTFRGMRQQLMKTFDEIYVLDLHGNTKKKETAPDGSKDENVFDIMQGVSICLMLKRVGINEKAKVFHVDLFGLRSAKYETLLLGNMRAMEWSEITPSSPFYLFIKQDTDLRSEYENGWKILDIMPSYNVAPVTGRDSLVIDFDEGTLKQRINRLLNGSSPDDYSLGDKLKRVRASRTKGIFTKCVYKPFDLRQFYYHPDLLNETKK